MWVDSGQTGRMEFQNSGTPGDWQTTVVTFHEPFSTPPIVLVTADDGPDTAANNLFDPIPLGLVRGSTRFGFTLAARNSAAESPGPFQTDASFHWIAFSCDVGCGGGLEAPIPPPP
jgi:hypothetical protein